MITRRQAEIVRAVALGASVNEVAQRLGVRRQSVRRHLSQLYSATGTRSQAGLVGWSVAHGVVTREELLAAYAGAGGSTG